VVAGLLVTGAAAPPAGHPGTAPGLVFVEFDRTSALDEYLALADEGRDRAQQAARDARTAIGALVDDLLSRFRGSEGVGEVFRTANAVPGVALRARPETVRELAGRPGIKSVRRLGTMRPANSGGDELGRALQAWQQTGRLGTGVRIGVIDTGIDYTHADFGGPGTPQAYRAVDPVHADEDTFPTEKVIGGVDLAGDDYDADSSDPARTVPQPDDNPLDCDGHGTHVAGTAAGYGVTAEGTTFHGDYGTLTPEKLDAMRIGPGAAPDASLYAIRVFGCDGSTALTALGLDHALDPDGDGDFDDHLDVVNLSLGSAFAAVDDPVNDFVHVLTEQGVLVVAAAGNSGDLYDAGGSPGNSPDALAVASVRDSHVRLDAIDVEGPVAGRQSGQYSVDYTGYDSLDLTAPVVELGGADPEGCEPYTPADAERVRGAIVWLAWSDEDAERSCGSLPRADNAQAAGAAGVLLTSAQSDFGARIAGNAGVPMFQLTGAATAALRPALAGGGLKVRLAGTLRDAQELDVPQIEDTPSDFTSRGVRGPTVKPDVAAPGESITSALSGSGAGRQQQSGTSMASPFVAGVAALVREEHPDWTPAQVKAAIMDTADGDVHAGENHTGPRLAPMRVGAGRVDARAALATSLLAANATRPGAVSVTFGPVEVPPGEPYRRREQVRISNLGSEPVALDVAYQPITTVPGVRIEAGPARVVAVPGADALVDVTLRIDDPAALRRTMDPTLHPVQGGRPRQYVADASGLVVLTPVDGQAVPLRVPVSVTPKPVSGLAADRTGDRLTLHGTAVDQGGGAEAYRSRVGVFELAADSRELPVCRRPDAVRGCVANDTGRGGDLRHVGVTSTAPAARAAGRPADALLAFAVTTWADLYNVGTLTQPTVEIDMDGDDRVDFTTTLTTLPGSDALVARTLDVRTDPEGVEVDVQPVNGFDGDVDTNVFDTNAWVLPVRLAALGIDTSARSAPLRYAVAVLGEYGPPGSNAGIVDFVEAPLTYDPLAPALDVRPADGAPDPGELLFPADPGTVLQGLGTGPVLVVLGQNGSGERVAVFDGNRSLLGG
jgi:subtilisin family serine protease